MLTREIRNWLKPDSQLGNSLDLDNLVITAPMTHRHFCVRRKRTCATLNAIRRSADLGNRGHTTDHKGTKSTKKAHRCFLAYNDLITAFIPLKPPTTSILTTVTQTPRNLPSASYRRLLKIRQAGKQERKTCIQSNK